MGKAQVISIPEFFAQGFPSQENRIVSHVKKHKRVYIRMTGAVVATLIIADISGFTYAAAADASGIDIKAHRIYSRLCLIGKWIIVIRGGVDIISSMSQGELDAMKKKVITYIVGYLALLGLPWLLDQATLLFDDSVTTSMSAE